MTDPTAEHHGREKERHAMVSTQLRCRGITDSRVLDAMAAIPRELFVPPELSPEAYADQALPIGFGQTISQPYIVAFMTQQLGLSPACRTLEVGTGTGYQTAILAMLSAEVFSVERSPALLARAGERLRRLDLANVTLQLGDGSAGIAEHAPFDRILVTAAAPRTPPTLVAQLAEGGVLVIPVGGPSEQMVVRVTRSAAGTTEIPLLPCRFVKLVGREGWEHVPQGD